uniref:Uncharacterized protein n=1 Tax=Nelumbo nucifera TaxID=4432 RepID=A0A822ZAH9_NELNU|nr:TPA_asm: hypothetical protein HUJ06_014778 [Nelumbo nucifera]
MSNKKKEKIINIEEIYKQMASSLRLGWLIQKCCQEILFTIHPTSLSIKFLCSYIVSGCSKVSSVYPSFINQCTFLYLEFFCSSTFSNFLFNII